LNVVHDNLEHGAEISYSENIQKLVTPKEELGVFQPTLPSERPDFRPRDVMEEMYERFPHLPPDDDPQSS